MVFHSISAQTRLLSDDSKSSDPQFFYDFIFTYQISSIEEHRRYLMFNSVYMRCSLIIIWF